MSICETVAEDTVLRTFGLMAGPNHGEGASFEASDARASDLKPGTVMFCSTYAMLVQAIDVF